MKTKLKIAITLTCMSVLCMASISQAHAFGNQSRGGVVAHIVAFVGSLLEPAVFDMDHSAMSSVRQLEAADPGIGELPGGGGADPVANSALMPFVSFESLLDEAP